MIDSPEDLASALGREDPRLRLHGVCHEHRAGGRVLAQEVWVDRGLLRVEEPPGTPDTVIGVDTVWHHDPSDGREITRPREPDIANPYTSPRILERQSVDFWRKTIGADPDAILSSVIARVLHGRPALAVTVPGNAGSFRVTVDEETGTWLEALMNGQPWLEWAWLHFDEPIDPSLFRGLSRA